MKKILVPLSLLWLAGCAKTTTHVRSDTTLGRVVVYRNGVAYFERYAEIDGDSLRLSVPGDKIDDFLKSLTVTDATTGKPAPVAYPTSGSAFVGQEQNNQQQQQSYGGSGLVSMEIQLQGPRPHKLLLSYVTEAPSWKPSYRVSVAKDGKMNIDAWAIVDNTSGEDWNKVKLGVGSSSALSFRFDLRSIRMVERETLRSNDLFAQAPPMGGSSYAGQPMPTGGKRVLAELDDVTLASAAVRDEEKEVMFDRKTASGKATGTISTGNRGGIGSGFGSGGGGRASSASRADMPMKKPMPSREPMVEKSKDQSGLERLAQQYRNSRRQVVVEGWADKNDGDKYGASLERANRAREQLIRAGLDPSQVVAVGNGVKAGRAGGVSIVEAPPEEAQQQGQFKQTASLEPASASAEPIGTSHFESSTPMTVPRLTSAMVSILSTETEGGFVYFYDPESSRGNTSFPFRAVRLKNPTDSVLESGPVTVFGEGRFIGEGMSEPIPARSFAFVPFALDRQIVVERKDDTRDSIARILSVQRGVFSTEVKHTRKKTLVMTNRMQDKATVYVRHTVTKGYKLAKAPPSQERMGESYLFKIEIGPGAKVEVDIEEETPLFKSTDIRSNVGMEMVRVYLSGATLEGNLKESVTKLLELQKEMGNLEQRITTMREQMGEYRQRMDELHAQIVTLKVVKSGGPLMQSLERKMQEVSDRLSKATIDLVAVQEKLMLAKIRFQDGVSELSLEKEASSPNPASGPGTTKI